jgi:1-acyl-sn-glycerol-3-phosphate acyltransferase
VVSNHSGTLPMDGLMTMLMIHDHTGRFLRPLGADLVFRMPIVSSLARKGGATLACNEDAERMLAGGELVGVWPEGFKGIGKPFGDRYKLQRFGRGGFVAAALRTGVPIVPLSVVGAEEIYPLVGNVPSLARLLGVPYVPITPFFPWLGPLGLVPLPSKWLLEFGEPIRTDEYDPGAADDPMLVFNVTDQVRETIQQSLYALLGERTSVWR